MKNYESRLKAIQKIADSKTAIIAIEESLAECK